jgi:hypothetical protein
VLQALRGDQWLDNHPDAPEEVRRAIKKQMRDGFYQDATIGSAWCTSKR